MYRYKNTLIKFYVFISVFCVIYTHIRNGIEEIIVMRVEINMGHFYDLQGFLHMILSGCCNLCITHIQKNYLKNGMLHFFVVCRFFYSVTYQYKP